MIAGLERWIAGRLELQPARARRLLLFLSLAVVLQAANSLARTAAEALFLANAGASALSTYLVIVGFVVVPAAGAMSKLIDRMPKAKLLRASLVLGAVVVVGLRAAVATGTLPAWYAVLIGIVLVEMLLNIQFFVLITDYFTSLEQKRLIGAITLASAAGGVTGGGLANLFVLFLSTADLLLLLPLLFGGVWLLVRRLEAREQPFTTAESDGGEGGAEKISNVVALVRQYPIVALMAIVGFLDVFLGAVGSVVTYEVYTKAFPDERQMTQFLGLLKGGMSVLQVVFVTWVTQPLIQKLGVGRMNVLYPLTTLASLLGLAVRPTLPVAIGASVNWDNVASSLANPVENLTYNAVPPRFLGRVRSISEGMLQPAGLTVAGITLALLVPRIGFGGIAWLAVGVSLLHVALGWYRGRKYGDAFASQLEAQAVDLSDPTARGALTPELAIEIERLLEDAANESRELGLELAARHEADRFLPTAQPILGGLVGRGRQAAVHYLAAIRGREQRDSLRKLLREGAPEVQALVLEAAMVAKEPLDLDDVTALLGSPDARVRGLARTAALRAGGETAPLLVRDPELGDEGLAAVTRGARAAHDRRLVPVLVEAMIRGLPETRAAALNALAELSPLGREVGAVVDLATMELDSESPRVRAGAFLLVARERPEEGARIAAGLEDSHASVRRAAVRGLSEWGDRALPYLAAALASSRPEAVLAAFEVLGGVRTRTAAQMALTHLAADHGRIQKNIAWLRQVPAGDERWVPLTFAIESSNRRAIDRILSVLGAFGLGKILRHARQALRGRDPRLRANAVEALASMPERRFVAPVLDLLEALAGEGEGTLTGTRREHRALDELSASDDPWLRVGAAEVARRLGRTLPERAAGDGSAIEQAARDANEGEQVMSRLLFLREVSLFRGMTLDELFALDGVFRRVDYLPGETIVEEGTVGDDFYLIASGEVAVVTGRGAERVRRAVLGRGDFFGEMSLFDDEPRSATCLADSACTLLTLDRHRFFGLIEQMPGLGLSICKTLTQRLRRSERELRAAQTTTSA